MKLKELLGDIKTWVLLICFFGGVAFSVSSFAKLPNRVDKVEQKTNEAHDKVQKLAHSVDKYIEVQAAVREQQEKREQLLLELIKEQRKHNGN
jgi:hypothetical protein